MSMPLEVTFMRHANSEANVVQKADKVGREHPQADAINARPDWQQRLSLEGVEETEIAKKFIDRELGGVAAYDLLYFSPFMRTRETAARISDDNETRWVHDDRVIERGWGAYGALSIKDRKATFPITHQMYKDSPLYVRLDGGESRYEVSDRYRDIQGTWHREASDKRVWVVSHGDFIDMAMYNIERLLPEEWERRNEDPRFALGNCAIVQYARINPFNPDDIRDKLTWRRILNPLTPDESPFGGEWVELPPRRHHSKAQLLSQVELFPRLIED